MRYTSRGTIGTCPVTGEVKELTIDCVSVPILGRTEPSYKKIRHDCDVDCPYAICPIFQSYEI